MPLPDSTTTPNPNAPKQHQDTRPAPIPDPEPVSPSLDEPDPAVFHHTPTRPQTDKSVIERPVGIERLP